MKPIRPPILLELPDELLGERVLIRPWRPGDGAALWEAVERSREPICYWLPFFALTPEDYMQAKAEWEQAQ